MHAPVMDNSLAINNWTRADLLGLEHLSAEEIITILDTAQQLKERTGGCAEKIDLLQGTTIANLGFSEVKFPKPVFPGDTLCVETEILDKRESKSRPGEGIVTFLPWLGNLGGEFVCTATRLAMMKTKAAEEAEEAAEEAEEAEVVVLQMKMLEEAGEMLRRLSRG